jgi:ABC-type dipeptide/oligopeptide/nickel transport system permease component
MNNFGQNVPEMQRSVQTMFELTVFLWVVALVVAIVVAVWIYKDAEARGKNGVAAALIALLSIFFNPPFFTIIVLCTWILLRPEKTRRGAANSGQHLPEKLPSDIVATPTSTEFLKGLEENT